MRTAVIIPARIGSERLARKALRMIAGTSLTERVWHQARKASGIDAVFVATDSEEIASHVEGFGGKAIMTDASCANGTERVAQAATRLGEVYDVIINVQGDEPLIEPQVIEAVAKAFQNAIILIATPVSPLRTTEELMSPNVVKCAIAQSGKALYFSRSPIPHVRSRANVVHDGIHWKHIGVYGFRGETLQEVVKLPQSLLEDSEKLEQLRWLEYGYDIHTVQVEYDSVSVDTEEDVLVVERILSTR